MPTPSILVLRSICNSESFPLREEEHAIPPEDDAAWTQLHDSSPMVCDLVLLPELPSTTDERQLTNANASLRDRRTFALQQYVREIVQVELNPCGTDNLLLVTDLPLNSRDYLLSVKSCRFNLLMEQGGRATLHVLPIEPVPSTFSLSFEPQHPNEHFFYYVPPLFNDTNESRQEQSTKEPTFSSEVTLAFDLSAARRTFRDQFDIRTTRGQLKAENQGPRKAPIYNLSGEGHDDDRSTEKEEKKPDTISWPSNQQCEVKSFFHSAITAFVHEHHYYMEQDAEDLVITSHTMKKGSARDTPEASTELSFGDLTDSMYPPKRERVPSNGFHEIFHQNISWHMTSQPERGNTSGLETGIPRNSRSGDTTAPSEKPEYSNESIGVNSGRSDPDFCGCAKQQPGARLPQQLPLLRELQSVAKQEEQFITVVLCGMACVAIFLLIAFVWALNRVRRITRYQATFRSQCQDTNSTDSESGSRLHGATPLASEEKVDHDWKSPTHPERVEPDVGGLIALIQKNLVSGHSYSQGPSPIGQVIPANYREASETIPGDLHDELFSATIISDPSICYPDFKIGAEKQQPSLPALVAFNPEKPLLFVPQLLKGNVKTTRPQESFGSGRIERSEDFATSTTSNCESAPPLVSFTPKQKHSTETDRLVAVNRLYSMRRRQQESSSNQTKIPSKGEQEQLHVEAAIDDIAQLSMISSSDDKTGRQLSPCSKLARQWGNDKILRRKDKMSTAPLIPDLPAERNHSPKTHIITNKESLQVRALENSEDNFRARDVQPNSLRLNKKHGETHLYISPFISPAVFEGSVSKTDIQSSLASTKIDNNDETFLQDFW